MHVSITNSYLADNHTQNYYFSALSGLAGDTQRLPRKPLLQQCVYQPDDTIQTVPKLSVHTMNINTCFHV